MHACAHTLPHTCASAHAHAHGHTNANTHTSAPEWLRVVSSADGKVGCAGVGPASSDWFPVGSSGPTQHTCHLFGHPVDSIFIILKHSWSCRMNPALQTECSHTKVASCSSSSTKRSDTTVSNDGHLLSNDACRSSSSNTVHIRLAQTLICIEPLTTMHAGVSHLLSAKKQHAMDYRKQQF